MKLNVLKTVAMLAVMAMMFGCATTDMVSTQFSSSKLSDAQFTNKVDTYVVVLDSSQSMQIMTGPGGAKVKKFQVAKDFVANMNNTVPNLTFMSALKTFGLGYRSNKDQVHNIYWGKTNTRDNFAKALDSVATAGGNTDLAPALEETSNDLISTLLLPMTDTRTAKHVGADQTAMDFKAWVGKTAVIVVTDGEFKNAQPFPAVENMKLRYGDRVKLYTVAIGNSEKGIANLQKLAEIGGGFAVNASELASASAMGNFVKKVLIDPDGDNDTVADAMDKCGSTPANTFVEADGCSPDTDQDGVLNYLDQCPDTPVGLKVDDRGCPSDTDGDGKYDDYDDCPETGEWLKDFHWGCPRDFRDVRFDVGMHKIRTWMYGYLDNVAAYLRENPGIKVELKGHTDHTGAEKSNVALSKKRVNAVKTYLMKEGASEGQLITGYYGEAKPKADNTTTAGRSKNRRVEIIPAN
ncbi:OmpA family protein [Desulfobacterales bacterium HSG17]|nr:OmpA family protein [Desulfobacterales bacterium HSG17]